MATNSADVTMEEELASLKQQRGTMKRNITNVQKKVEKDGDSTDATILECRLQILESYFKQVCHIQGQIEKLNPADLSRTDLEEIFIVAKAKIVSLLNKHRGSMQIDQTLLNASVSSSPHHTRLPSLKLPKFDGKYSDYKRFITTFHNMVHGSSSISDIDKFNYLLNCLSGPALAVVEPFQVTEENYPKALKRLKDRYDNKVLIFLEHINTLFNIAVMSKGDSAALRNIIDTVSAIRGSLLSLGSEMDVLNGLLTHIVLSKLDSESKMNYDERQDFKSLPSWDSCYETLSHRCQFLESHGKKVEVHDKSKGAKPKPTNNRFSHTFVNSNSNCVYCGSPDHNISTCSSFSSLVVSERFCFIKRNNCCINCLRKGHMLSKCLAKSRCRVCQSRHHTLLHKYSSPEQTDSSTSQQVHPQTSPGNQNNPVSFVVRSLKRAIIPTAVVLVKDSCGTFHPVRALLDSCSEINFISEETAKRLRLRSRPYHQKVSGIGEVRTNIKTSVCATVKSRVSAFQWSSTFAVTKSISARQPGEYIRTCHWKIPPSLELADPLFHKPQHIDMLISTEIFFDLLLDHKLPLGEGMPCLTSTVFGWIVGGSYNSGAQTSLHTCNLATSSSNIDSTLRQFWEIEEYANTPSKYSPEEEECERQFVQSVCTNKNGRIEVRLPFKKSPEILGDSFEIARRRFLSLEKRLERDSTLKSMYVEFMDEYLSLGHMSPYTYSLSGPNYIIPHHCVLRPQSTTTKIRVVFDASAKTSSNHSLNDILMVLRDDLYVDDVLTGSHDVETLLKKKYELVNLLKLHGLELAKWNSNYGSISNTQDDEIHIKIEDDVTKTLGMAWKPKSDIFCFRFQLPKVVAPTKRSILSVVAKIYDLLGLLSPIVIRAKIVLQEMWVQQCNWDDIINSHLKSLWLQIQEDLEYMEKIEVPRYVFTGPEYRGEIHGFADASQRAYGCCIYYRVCIDGVYQNALLIAKSKVAPIKAQSVPRLELCAAVLLSKTWIKIKPKIQEFVSSTYFWTDSKIVLQWLKLHSSTLQCFVANRVSYLQENTRDVFWRHVPSKSNPADLVSRGCNAQKLPNTIWFTGPDFLQQHSSNWPPTEEETSVSPLECRKAAVFKCSGVTPSIIEGVIDKHSSYFKIIRIIAYIFRLFNRCPADHALKPQDLVHIQPIELDHIFFRIVAHIQQSNFGGDLQALAKGTIVHPSLQKLTPFLHETNVGSGVVNIIRVGGRLSNAPIPYDARFPALLPKNHRFVKLYSEQLHRSHLHAGPKVLLGILRQKVWIVNARDVVRKVVRECVHCFRYKPKLVEQIMGNLPADRLRAHRPFLVAGVDFCGPFLTSYRIRGKAPYKTYIAVFVCFSSKATHLELVSDLSTNNFILCLKRFVGRRGIPQKLYCDNATNFVGAHNKLNELKQLFFGESMASELHTYTSQVGFEFCFIPPRAPHFGGLWEAAVKSVKTLLVKNVAQAYLTFEEMQTLIIEIEAILNSRPICPLSDDPNDGEALTPGHLLIGSSLIALPDENLKDIKQTSLTRWQRITYLKQQFWHLWSRDYITSLQHRSKWVNVQPNIVEGQLVVVHEDNAPPQQWHLTRVTKSIIGADGRVRVVELKTKNGHCRRPIHKVAPLPSQF